MKKIKLAMYMALVLLFVPVVALGQTLTVDSTGNNNDIGYDVTGGTNLTASITQGNSTSDPPVEANDNLVRITQVGGNTNGATVTQNGYFNEANQYQYYGATNTALIEQNGTWNNPDVVNKATQTQGSPDDTSTTGSTGNFASIHQSGYSNTAEQTQVGTDLNSSLPMLPDTYNAYDWGIYQSGSRNKATQNQTGNENVAQIMQYGSWGDATQNQYYGESNKAVIQQSGTWEASRTSKNQATQTQGSPDDTSTTGSRLNFASIYQYGFGNMANQTQVGTELNNTLNLPAGIGWGIYQYGDNNKATQSQTGNKHEAKIKQTGSWGDATQNQYYGGSNTAKIEQEGEGTGSWLANKATQTQGSPDDTSTTGSTGNFASIYQKGSANTAEQLQIGTSNNSSLSAPISTNPKSWGIYQEGNGNYANQSQTGDNNEAQIIQGGNGNTATQNKAAQSQTGSNHVAQITQTGLSGEATQNQYYGKWNTATIVQEGNGTDSWLANKATQTQGVNDPDALASTLNVASICQKGSANTAEQLQIGTSNNSSLSAPDPTEPNSWGIYQDGNGNYANQSQTGNNNEAQIIQTGHGNSAIQIEDGTLAKQVARVTQNGNYNQMTQDLSGSVSHTSVITQNGNNMRMTVIMR
jgi:hypothetical protein